jgi:hypothetical protein
MNHERCHLVYTVMIHYAHASRSPRNRDSGKGFGCPPADGRSSWADYELRRFAQLIIVCENPPGEWREKLLTEVLERDDALKEIAMSIDHSWLPH